MSNRLSKYFADFVEPDKPSSPLVIRIEGADLYSIHELYAAIVRVLKARKEDRLPMMVTEEYDKESGMYRQSFIVSS